MDPSDHDRNDLNNGAQVGSHESTHANGSSLEEDHRWLRSVVENSSEIVVVVDPNGTLGYANPAWGRALGYDPRVAIGTMNVLDHVHPDDLRRVEMAFAEGLKDPGRRPSVEYRFRHKDGRWVWLESVGTNLLNDPEVGGYVVNSRDVTGRKEAEGRLREAEERYRTLVEQIPAVTYVDPVDDPDTSLYTSPHIERMLGYTPEEWVEEKLWEKRLHPDDRERILAADEGLEVHGEPFAEEYRLLAKDGSVVWVREEAVLVRGEDGEPLFWQGVISDFTERRNTEEALRRSEALLAESQRIARLGTWEWDVSTGEVWWSEETYRIHGLEPGEQAALRGKVEEAFFPDDLPLYRRKIEEALSGEAEGYDYEHRMRKADREVRWVHAQAEVFRDEEGEPLRMVGTVHDITERKAAEDRLRETEERYRTLVERIPAVTFVDRADGSEESLYVSPQIEGMLGYTPEEWAAEKLWRERLHPDDRGWVLASDERFEVRGDPVDQEYRLLAKDGSVVWVREETVLVRDEAGEPQFVQGIMSDVTEKKRTEERLHHLAFHDPLTGLPNRRLIMDRLGHALTRTRRQGDRVAVLFMDLDQFKVVNDSLGHDAGDLLLTVVAQRLGRCLRPEDTLARFGGDEFVVLIEDVDDPAEAVRVAERITEELRRPFILEERQLYAAASIGVSLGGARTHDPEALLREADTAMYRAKEGGSGYEVFDPAMYERALARLELENDLRRAIEEDEFVVHYQPIVSLQTGGLWGFEALVRWEHPERGLLDPSEFVPVAEESGLVVPMGELVLDEACRRAVEWQREFPRNPPLAVSVNLSGRQLSRPDLAETVEGVLRRTGFEGNCLCLDVTETVYVKALEGNTQALDRLRNMGVRISIDDFGTGYSSLSYLKRLPADALKIDKSFVRGLGEDVEDTTIVRMVVELAHTLGMEVIAEGVETEEQAALLAEMGCDKAQGYHFSRPLPPEDVPGFLGG